MKVQGEAIVITGAAQGLGRKMAEMLAGQGADLALVDLDQAKLKDTVRLCGRGKVKDYPVDVTEEPAVEALFRKVRDDFGRIDGLINNAGVTGDALLVKAADGKVQGKMSLAEFDRVITVDLRGVFLCAREAAVHMIEGGSGGGHHQHFQHFSRRQHWADQLCCRQDRRRRDDRDLGEGTGALPHPRRRYRSRI
jgi:3-oxoacyl-[acyl-carrier protein] reductase